MLVPWLPRKVFRCVKQQEIAMMRVFRGIGFRDTRYVCHAWWIACFTPSTRLDSARLGSARGERFTHEKWEKKGKACFLLVVVALRSLSENGNSRSTGCSLVSSSTLDRCYKTYEISFDVQDVSYTLGVISWNIISATCSCSHDATRTPIDPRNIAIYEITLHFRLNEFRAPKTLWYLTFRKNAEREMPR